MGRELFGTDGIRGVAGQAPLDDASVYAFGVALGEWAVGHTSAQGVREPAVCIGIDTRESGEWLAETVAAGLRQASVRVRYAGVTTTPGVAHLTRIEEFVAGVMISASHNPYQDNGLKAFNHSGFKLPDAEEARLEERILELLGNGVTPARLSLQVDESLDRHYIEALAGTYAGDLKGLRLVLDCAHGAAYKLGPELFERLGARVTLTGCSPNGRNINDGVGAVHTEALRRKVIESGADVGAAFDGDADRCMIVSRSGKLIDGDHMLLIVARHMHQRGELNGAVVATVMSNLGLQRALEAQGIRLLRTAVGDRYVLEEMERSGHPIGGEQSGHVIFRRYATTGDGLLTAMRVLEVLRGSGRTLDALTADFMVYPQRLVNVRFARKRPLEQLPTVQTAIREAEELFGEAGRVLVRFSGTEPVARVMVEGPDLLQVEQQAQRIAAEIQRALSQ